MHEKSSFPSREELDQAFHFLQDEITRISVAEEVEMAKQKNKGQVEQ
ncbi:hypothetical protein [Neobacillus niacini]|nr:hypothetical protein [Neobacillus niacini]MDR7000565.1 hypothetical protein [Neobacillus niacini]